MNSPAGGGSKKMLWAGYVLSALPVLFVLMGSIMKLVRATAVLEGFQSMGIPERLILPIGLIELVCVIVYVIPRTSVLGAILMTGLLGGATLTGLRVGDPSFFAPVLLGMMAWGGIFLRDERVRALIPWKR